MGDRKRASRKRAVGTREHIIAYLADNTELFDPGGMASTRLAAAVGYPGSSVAFAQLLSGMERSGLIERDVRGKRTYRIKLGSTAGTDLAAAGPAAGDLEAAGPAAGDAAARAGGASGVRGLAGMLGPGSASGFDYDELARRLLAQVVRRLAGTGGAGGADAAVAPDLTTLRETVAGLEYELADAWSKHGKLAEENVRLREQLRAAEQSLALARESLRRLPIAADLDSSEVLLLQRLLAGDTAGWEAARSLRA
ncbi:MAG TPA: hypothetical protein VGS06_40900 [Streptosporangiaceae bacterium]|nr:hypothetical protein [Streptosporangiaceae bacterium]